MTKTKVVQNVENTLACLTNERLQIYVRSTFQTFNRGKKNYFIYAKLDTNCTAEIIRQLTPNRQDATQR